MIYENPLELIGNTPVIKYKNIYIKYEGYNLTNSIKDRSALSIVLNNLDKEKTLVTTTSGNFGISLSCICAYLKQKLIVIMQEGFSNKKNIMESFGTKVIETSKEEGMKGTIKKLKEFNTDEYVIINQFTSLYNPLGYVPLVKEIMNDFKKLDYVVLGVGSSGTYYTLSRCLKKVYPKIKIVGVEPYDENTIDGIGSNIKYGFKSRIKDIYIEKVLEKDAYEKTNKLLKDGYNVGLSTGANIYVAEKIKEENKDAIVLVISADNSFKYSDRLV